MTHLNFSRANQEKILVKQSTNIKCDEINIMNIINDNTFNLHNSLLNNDNRYMKVTLKSKLIGSCKVANFGQLSRILNLYMAYKT